MLMLPVSQQCLAKDQLHRWSWQVPLPHCRTDPALGAYSWQDEISPTNKNTRIIPGYGGNAPLAAMPNLLMAAGHASEGISVCQSTERTFTSCLDILTTLMLKNSFRQDQIISSSSVGNFTETKSASTSWQPVCRASQWKVFTAYKQLKLVSRRIFIFIWMDLGSVKWVLKGASMWHPQETFSQYLKLSL